MFHITKNVTHTRSNFRTNNWQHDFRRVGSAVQGLWQDTDLTQDRGLVPVDSLVDDLAILVEFHKSDLVIGGRVSDFAENLKKAHTKATLISFPVGLTLGRSQEIVSLWVRVIRVSSTT